MKRFLKICKKFQITKSLQSFCNSYAKKNSIVTKLSINPSLRWQNFQIFFGQKIL